MLGTVFAFASIITKSASLFTPGGHFNWKKINDFGAVGKCSKIDCEVLCWQKKITIRPLAAPARTANKTRLNRYDKSRI